MVFNLWMFLSIGAVFAITMATIAIVTTHKRKLKQLEIEALKVNETNLRVEVDDVVNEKLGDLVSRIEVLEAIVTDKKYQLNEEITQLK